MLFVLFLNFDKSYIVLFYFDVQKIGNKLNIFICHINMKLK